MHGSGKSEFLACVYEGDFAHNKREGHGTLQYADGYVFQGEFIANKPRADLLLRDLFGVISDLLDGKGVLCSVEGDRFEGGWVDGKRSGQGEMAWANGDR